MLTGTHAVLMHLTCSRGFELYMKMYSLLKELNLTPFVHGGEGIYIGWGRRAVNKYTFFETKEFDVLRKNEITELRNIRIKLMN